MKRSGKKKTRPRALAILSGGLDSTVALCMARKKLRFECAVIFNYGQKAYHAERRACRKLSERLSFDLLEVDLSWLSSFSRSALTDKKKIPTLNYDDLNRMPKLKRSAAAVTVHNRNMIFISCAAGIALDKGCHVLVAGFNAEEAATFPDNSPSFLSAVNLALRSSLRPRRLAVASPTLKMTKKDIVRYALKHNVPLGDIYSCYLGRRIMCGMCESCLRLKRALAANDALNSAGVIFQK
jgi:7-cyano-7-deazaguanine synthase